MSKGLVFSAVTRRFAGREALVGLDLECRTGELTCLVGPNGAGKSTALALAAGLLAPSAGAVSWRGRPIATDGACRDTGFLPQRSSFHRLLRVDEVVAFAAAARQAGGREVERVVELAGLGDLGDRFVGELSGGWIRRLGLLSALLGSPGLVLLDEPFVGLDPETHDRLTAALRGRVAAGGTVVVASHAFEVIDELAARVVVLNEGRRVHATRHGTTGVGPGSTRRAYRDALRRGVEPLATRRETA